MTNKEEEAVDGVDSNDIQVKEIQVIVLQSDGNASFLRAARGGNLEKVLEYLKGSIDINTSNANGLNALHLASKEGHVVVVTELLKRGANVNAATKKGNTALHIASLAGQEEVMKILVQHGANVNVQSQNGFTPLYMAAQENHDRVVSNLLSSGANQSLATEDGFTPLAVALQQGHDKVVAVLLENDAKGRVRLPALHIAAKKDDCKAASLLLQNDHNPDVQSKSGFTPLHIAAHYGNESIATLLLEKHADVNFAAKHQITPLHVASKWGKANMVILLLDKGAKIDSSTRDGLTPLHCAARSGHDQVIDLLLERGAPMSAKTKNGLSPLHMACQGDHVDSARILLYHKASVDDVTVDYLTALHVAAHCGHVRVAKLLLDRKADPNARALNGFTPLHIACKKNRIKVVELLLKHGASIEATTESGLTPLHVASFMGCMNIVIYLIQHRANPDIPTVRGETPLHLAARANQTDIIRILLRNGAHVDARAREDQTPLHIAARLGNVDIVGLLLQHGAAVDATTKDMYTALHIAAKEGQEEVASVLLDHSASLTATTKKGFTPLHLAAKYGNIKVARLLLQKDAPVDAQGKNGVTPLHVAAHYDHVNVALLLLDKGASPHATAKNGYTSLHIAAKKNQMDIATTLLEYGAKAEAESKAGFTPLHLASQEGHTDMTTLLIEHHANPNSKAKNGLTPLHLCAQDDRVNVAAILVKNGAEVDPPTKAGYTPLHVASHFGQINMIRFLLQHNADVNALNSHGYTPLHQAAQQGHTLIINLLLEHRASPNVTTNQGQTALSIAQRLGYISVIETLKVVTETTVTTTTTTITEEKYRVVAPETMQETFMSDSEDEGVGEDTMLGDQSFRYLSADEMKSLGDDSLPIDVTKDERSHDSLGMGLDHGAPLTVEEEHLSPQHVSHNVDAVFTGNFAPDNIDISRAPIHAGKLKWKTFLVSFMVDARGGAMRGCRHSGVRVIIPPRKAPMPMRITCRYLRKEKLIHPPPLMEGEACASRILEVGPVGAKFLGPVILEIPHFASLRGKEREITILRSDNGETWREHTLEASEEAVQDVLNESFEGEDLSALEDLNTNRITRILTTDFPQYFAIVTRIRQEVHAIGPEGGMVSSTVVPQVQAIFPEGALTKKIKVGLQAQPIPSELVTKLLGNRIAVSPIVTVEPRRRKFHKPITLTIPVPQAATRGMINQYSGDAPTLRLLCSITGGTTKAQWEDVTGSTPLTFVNDCVSFTTTVSARFWLMDCRQVAEATKFATELYREAIHAPFMAKFVVFAKRPEPSEAQLRVFCMTDDKEDKTLESQERFIEVAKSRDVEVLESKPQFLEFAGNLVPVTKSGEQLSLTFQAFKENRLPFTTRIKDVHQDPLGRIAFMKEPKVSKGEPPQTPICNLNILLPDIYTVDGRPTAEMVTLEKKYGFVEETGLAKPELIQRADLRLSDIARELNRDWVPLALQLDIPESDIKSIKTECPDDMMQQALTMLRLWMQRAGTKATGNSLDKALRKINREDIVDKCMFNVKLFTDDVEKAVAKVRLDQSGFDAFKEELGPSRDASLRREVSLDVSYDEQDLMKVSEAESAAETSSESGSVHGKEPHDTSELRGESKLLKGIKTPPPSPAEKEEKEQVVVYETPATTSTRVETREVMDDGSVRRVVTTVTKTSVAPEMEEMPHELRDQLAKLESETWPSAEMDTSQVSVSSLPEDEKSEPTTATVSSAGTDMASDEKPQIETHTDEAEWTETDESGGVRHVIQKRTHTTVKMQDQGLCEPGKQQWDSTTTEQQPEEKHSDTISPEEELSFEQKRSFFQRLSIDGSTTSVPLPASKPSQSSSDSSKKSCEGDGNGEVLEEQISFSERLKFFEKPQDTSSKRNSYPQYQGTESPDLSDKRKSFPSHAATFVEEEGSISVQDMKKYFNPEEVQAQRTCLEEEVEVSKPVSELKKMFKDDDEKKPEKVQSLEAEQTELWQQLDDNIQQAKVAMENMERELTEAEAMSAIQERNQPAFAEALSDVNSKTEMKLMVKTVEPGRESIEVRSMKGYVDSQTGEIARVLVRSPVQDVSGETISATQSLGKEIDTHMHDTNEAAVGIAEKLHDSNEWDVIGDSELIEAREMEIESSCSMEKSWIMVEESEKEIVKSGVETSHEEIAPIAERIRDEGPSSVLDDFKLPMHPDTEEGDSCNLKDQPLNSTVVSPLHNTVIDNISAISDLEKHTDTVTVLQAVSLERRLPDWEKQEIMQSAVIPSDISMSESQSLVEQVGKDVSVSQTGISSSTVSAHSSELEKVKESEILSLTTKLPSTERLDFKAKFEDDISPAMSFKSEMTKSVIETGRIMTTLDSELLETTPDHKNSASQAEIGFDNKNLKTMGETDVCGNALASVTEPLDVYSDSTKQVTFSDKIDEIKHFEMFSKLEISNNISEFPSEQLESSSVEETFCERSSTRQILTPSVHDENLSLRAVASVSKMQSVELETDVSASKEIGVIDEVPTLKQLEIQTLPTHTPLSIKHQNLSSFSEIRSDKLEIGFNTKTLEYEPEGETDVSIKTLTSVTEPLGVQSKITFSEKSVEVDNGGIMFSGIEETKSVVQPENKTDRNYSLEHASDTHPITDTSLPKFVDGLTYLPETESGKIDLALQSNVAPVEDEKLADGEKVISGETEIKDTSFNLAYEQFETKTLTDTVQPESMDFDRNVIRETEISERASDVIESLHPKETALFSKANTETKIEECITQSEIIGSDRKIVRETEISEQTSEFTEPLQIKTQDTVSEVQLENKTDLQTIQSDIVEYDRNVVRETNISELRSQFTEPLNLKPDTVETSVIEEELQSKTDAKIMPPLSEVPSKAVAMEISDSTVLAAAGTRTLISKKTRLESNIDVLESSSTEVEISDNTLEKMETDKISSLVEDEFQTKIENYIETDENKFSATGEASNFKEKDVASVLKTTAENELNLTESAILDKKVTDTESQKLGVDEAGLSLLAKVETSGVIATQKQETINELTQSKTDDAITLQKNIIEQISTRYSESLDAETALHLIVDKQTLGEGSDNINIKSKETVLAEIIDLETEGDKKEFKLYSEKLENLGVGTHEKEISGPGTVSGLLSEKLVKETFDEEICRKDTPLVTEIFESKTDRKEMIIDMDKDIAVTEIQIKESKTAKLQTPNSADIFSHDNGVVMEGEHLSNLESESGIEQYVLLSQKDIQFKEGESLLTKFSENLTLTAVEKPATCDAKSLTVTEISEGITTQKTLNERDVPECVSKTIIKTVTNQTQIISKHYPDSFILDKFDKVSDGDDASLTTVSPENVTPYDISYSNSSLSKDQGLGSQEYLSSDDEMKEWKKHQGSSNAILSTRSSFMLGSTKPPELDSSILSLQTVDTPEICELTEQHGVSTVPLVVNDVPVLDWNKEFCFASDFAQSSLHTFSGETAKLDDAIDINSSVQSSFKEPTNVNQSAEKGHLGIVESSVHTVCFDENVEVDLVKPSDTALDGLHTCQANIPILTSLETTVPLILSGEIRDSSGKGSSSSGSSDRAECINGDEENGKQSLSGGESLDDEAEVEKCNLHVLMDAFDVSQSEIDLLEVRTEDEAPDIDEFAISPMEADDKPIVATVTSIAEHDKGTKNNGAISNVPLEDNFQMTVISQDDSSTGNINIASLTSERTRDDKGDVSTLEKSAFLSSHCQPEKEVPSDSDSGIAGFQTEVTKDKSQANIEVYMSQTLTESQFNLPLGSYVGVTGRNSEEKFTTATCHPDITSSEHGLTEQRRIESELTEDEISPPKDYPSPPKTVGLEEVESPIPRPSPPEPSFGLEQEISPVVDYPEGLTADLQVRVGVSPTELDYQHESAFRGEISSHKMSRDSKQDDVFSSENVAFTEKTVRVTRTFTGSSGTGLSETSVDLEIEQNYPESAVSMAFENTAFVGAEAIDVVNELAGVRSPYEVFRSPDPSLPAQVSDLLRAQGISESVGDIAENIDQKIMSQIFSEELDQSIEENMPEIKQLSREVSEEGIVDVDREAKYAQQIRSEIFTHELEEDISCCSPEKKEITYGVHISKGSHEASSLPHEFGDHTQKMFTPTDNDNSLLKSVSPVASVSLALSTASLQESISAHSAYSTEGDVHSYNDERLSPRESDILPPEHVPTHDAISPVPSHEVPEQSMSVSPHPPPSEIPITSSNAVVSVLSSSIHLAQSDTLEDKAREIIDQTSKGPYFQTQRAVPDSLPFDTNDHDTSFQRELSPVCTAIEQRTEQVTWEVPVHQQSVDIITEEVKMIPTEKQLIVEHDEEGDTSDFNTSHYPDEKEARDIAQKIIHDIKTAVATRPPLTQVSSEISDEDLVERDEPSFHEIESPHSQYEQGFSKKVIEEQQEGDTLQLKDQVVAQTDSRVVIHTKTVAIDVVQKEESGSDKKDSSSTEEKLLESRSETDTSDQMTGGVVLRGKTKKHEEKRVSREIESYSSSGETESHYYSYDTSDSARTPRGTPAASRPCSSEFEINVTSGQASEYETCVTSQNGSSSYMTAASSQDGSFMTARSSVSHSSRESAYSGDSESSGHLASVEVSSEASETLVPSAQDLELDLTREVETPTMDEESHFLLDGSVKEPYDTEIPESIIRSGIEIPFMKEMQFGMQGRDSFHKEKDEPSSPFEMVADDGVGYSGDAVSKKWQDEKTAYFGSYRRSDSSDSSSSTVGSNTPSTKPKSVGITTDQAAAELLPPQSPDEQSIEPHGFSAEDIDHLDQKCSITENEAFSASESSVTRSEHTWQSNSTDTVIYTSQTQSTTQTISTASSTISQYSCAPPEEPSWYAQVNGPVEVDYIPEYDVPEEYMQPSNEQHHVQMHEAPPSMPAPSRMEEVQTSITAVDRITDPSEEYIESMLSDQEMQDITNIQDEIECQEALLREYQKQDASATQSIGHGSLKDVHHPSLPESELEEEYQQQVEESTALSHGIPFIPAQEFMQPLDERSSLPECEQGDLPSDFHIHDSKQQKLPSQKGQADIGAEVKGAQSSSTELPSSLKSTLTDSFEIVEKADILDTSPEDDRYEDITKDVDEVQPHCVDLPAQFLNENEKKALDALNYNTQVAPNICEEDDEAMELGSDKAPEERDELDESSMKNSYSYGMQFERAHDFDDEDMQNYGDMELWTHQEVDEETFVVDIDEKPKFVAPSAEFDTLAGRKFFSKSGEQDDASTSSLQEFEHFEAEMASGRKSSTSSADSINCRQIHSKSGEHDDVSMNSLTEFEKLERECIDVDKPEAAAKEDTNRLTEIEEGHESQDSEASQETLSGHEDDSDDSNDSDDYEKRMSEIEEIIKQAQTNVEKFQTEGSEAIHQTVRSGTFSGTGSTESSLLGRSPSPKKPDEDSLEEEAKLAHCTHTHKREQSETVATTSALPRHLLAERTISGHSIESWESFPKSSASTATQYDTESLRDQDLDVEDGDLDYLHEKRHLSDKDSDDELAPDSLYECNFMEKDSLRERSHEMDSLEEEKTAMQDSLYSVKDIDHDEILSGEYNFQHHTSGRETSMSDDAQLKKEMEAILLDSSLKGDCMISSTDSLEPSSSTATHATYQFETDSMMSSSINSAQTSGEESTMVFSTDTFEQDPKTVYSYSESDSFKTVISAGHSSEKDFDISTITSSSLESGDSTKAQTLLEESMFGYVGKSETDLQEPVVEEVRTVDDKGNVVITRKMKRVVVVDPVLYGATSADTEERMREFLKQSLGSGEEEMEEQRSIDETGNVTITRTIKRHVLSEPQVHTQTFTGPDAELKSQEYVKSFKKMLPTEDVDDFEDTDEHGNIIKVSQQVIIQPEVRTLTFTGPDAHEQMEEYMRSCSTEAAFLEREDSKGSKPKSSPTHSSSSHDANIVTASAPPSSVLGSHLVTGFANQPVQQGMSADHFQAEDFNRGGMDEVQIQNNFWVDSGDGSQQQLGTRVVTTRTTTRVFPTGEEQVIADTSQTETADDQLRRSMQNILDQFMDTEAPKEKK